MSDLPPPLPDRPVQPLPYADPGVYQHPKPRTPYIGRLAIGCFGYVLLSAGWVALGAASPVLGKFAWSGWALMTVALLGFSLYLRIRYGFSGVGVGILISLGVGVAITALLVIGLVLLLISICGKGNNPVGSSISPAPTTSTTLPDTQGSTDSATQPALPATQPAVP